MNNYQKVILLIGALVVVLIVIYPPWVYTFQSQGISQVTNPAGYHLIFEPPSRQGLSFIHGVRIDLDRFIIQALGVVTIFGVIFYLSRSKTK